MKKNAVEEPVKQSEESAFEYRCFGDLDYKIKKSSLDEPYLKKYISILINWVQSIVHEAGFVVKEIEDVGSLSVIRVLYSKCTNTKMDYEFKAKSIDACIKELENLLELIEKKISYKANISKWNATMVFYGYIPAILHLLTAMHMEFATIEEPFSGKVEIPIISIDTRGMQYNTNDVIFDKEEIYKILNKDEALDSIFADPAKNKQFKEGILRFVDTHLAPMDKKIVDVTKDFKNGVNLIYLAASIGNFYIPTHAYCLKPLAKTESEHNIKVSFELLRQLGLGTNIIDSADIFNGVEKTTLRLLYSIFKKFK